jgi:two-component system chemotaxis response regulator CheB
MAGHDVIVIGASAGGVESLARLVQDLPPGLPAAVFVVCHFPPGSCSRLPDILSRSGPLLARHARDGEPIYPGHVYVAPPGQHMQVEDGQVRLNRNPRENRHRPAIDPLFRSAARAFGPRVVGVVLSGTLYDGVAGLLAVRAAGGVAVIQDPADALLAPLPQNALDIAGADYLVPLAALPSLLVELVQRPVSPEGSPPMPTDPLEKMPEVQHADMEAQANGQRRGEVAVFTCPECGGVLWQVDEQQLLRFRCHVGHAYYAEALLADQAEHLDAALWSAVRIFKEQSVLTRQLAAMHRQQGRAEAAERTEEQGKQAEHYGDLIQQFLLRLTNGNNAPDPNAAPPPA